MHHVVCGAELGVDGCSSLVVSSRGHSACSFRCVIGGLFSGVVVVRCWLEVLVTSLHDDATKSSIFMC